jgi:hypothetical protein
MSPSSSTKKKATATEQPEATAEGCVHHWVIDPPNGAVSKGRCKACGEEREFRNSFEYSSWYGNKSPGAKGRANGPQKSEAAASETPKAKTSPAEKPAAEKPRTKTSGT